MTCDVLFCGFHLNCSPLGLYFIRQPTCIFCSQTFFNYGRLMFTCLFSMEIAARLLVTPDALQFSLRQVSFWPQLALCLAIYTNSYVVMCLITTCVKKEFLFFSHKNKSEDSSRMVRLLKEVNRDLHSLFIVLLPTAWLSNSWLKRAVELA